MNIKIVENKYINTALLLMLVSAVIHMVILCFQALVQWDFYPINYFNILDLDYFFGSVFQNFWGNVIGTLVAAAIYGSILKYNGAN